MNGTTEYKKTQSRKWRLVLLVILLAVLGTFAPTLLSAWVFNSTSPIVILNGGHFVTLITLVVSAYFGANVWQKQVESKATLNFSATASVSSETSDSGVGDSSEVKTTTKTKATGVTVVKANEEGEA